jgi:hypothetical protein
MSVQAQSQPEVDEYSRRVGASEGRIRVTAKQNASQQTVGREVHFFLEIEIRRCKQIQDQLSFKEKYG